MLKVIFENDYCGKGYATLVPDSAEWVTCERLEDMTNLFKSVLRTLSFTESQIDSVLNRNYNHSCPYDFEDDEDWNILNFLKNSKRQADSFISLM